MRRAAHPGSADRAPAVHPAGNARDPRLQRRVPPVALRRDGFRAHAGNAGRDASYATRIACSAGTSPTEARRRRPGDADRRCGHGHGRGNRSSLPSGLAQRDGCARGSPGGGAVRATHGPALPVALRLTSGRSLSRARAPQGRGARPGRSSPGWTASGGWDITGSHSPQCRGYRESGRGERHGKDLPWRTARAAPPSRRITICGRRPARIEVARQVGPPITQADHRDGPAAHRLRRFILQVSRCTATWHLMSTGATVQKRMRRLNDRLRRSVYILSRAIFCGRMRPT